MKNGAKKILYVAAIILFVAVPLMLFSLAINRGPWHTPIAICMTQLWTIGGLCKQYADNHDGHFPEDWNQLPPHLRAGLFVTQEHSSKAGNMTNVMEWTDFVYIHGMTTASPPNKIMAFLPPGHFKTRNCAVVLFANGKVTWLGLEDFTRRLNQEHVGNEIKPH